MEITVVIWHYTNKIDLYHSSFDSLRKSSSPAGSHIIYQTYCISWPWPSGHAASPKQMASAGAWQGVEKREAYCNCQARSLESHSFLLHWSQSPHTCSPSSPLSNFSCKTEWEIWGRCEKGKLLSLTLKPRTLDLKWKLIQDHCTQKLFQAFPLNTETVDAWQIGEVTV